MYSNWLMSEGIIPKCPFTWFRNWLFFTDFKDYQLLESSSMMPKLGLRRIWIWPLHPPMISPIFRLFAIGETTPQIGCVQLQEFLKFAQIVSEPYHIFYFCVLAIYRRPNRYYRFSIWLDSHTYLRLIYYMMIYTYLYIYKCIYVYMYVCTYIYILYQPSISWKSLVVCCFQTGHCCECCDPAAAPRESRRRRGHWYRWRRFRHVGVQKSAGPWAAWLDSDGNHWILWWFNDDLMGFTLW